MLLFFEILSFKYHTKTLNEWSLTLVFFFMEIYFNLNFQENENNRFFFHETYDFKILGNEALLIASYEDIKSSIYNQLAVK